MDGEKLFGATQALPQPREKGRTTLELRGQPFDRSQSRWTDVMFHPFDIMFDHALIDAEELEEIRQELMSPGNIAGKRFTSGGQDEAAILLVIEETFAIESLHHVGDAGLRNAETGRDIDDPGVALGIDQFENTLEVIFHRGRAARGVRFGGHGDKNGPSASWVKQKIIEG